MKAFIVVILGMLALAPAVAEAQLVEGLATARCNRMGIDPAYCRAELEMSRARDYRYPRSGRIPPSGRNGYPYPSRYGSGYYDPAYLEQMFNLPEGLMACQMDFGNGRVQGCHTLLKSVEYMEFHAERHEDLNEILGTYHFEKGKSHFRGFDDTNHRLGRTGAIAIGTGAGATGGAVFAGRKGAVIGGGIGAFAGWLTTRKSNNHDNCLIIEPMTAQSDGLAVPVTTEVPGVVSTLPVLSVTTATSNGPLPLSGLSLRNDSGETAVVYDGDTAVTTLAPGDSAPVSEPRDSYRAVVKRFNERGRVVFWELGRRTEGATLVFLPEGQRLSESR